MALSEEEQQKQREKLAAMRKNQSEMGDRSLIMVHTGAGKGKTTAAMGMVYRTIAHGWKAAVVQFMKNETDYKYGEVKLAAQFDNLDVFTMGAGFTWDTQNRDLDIATTLKTWEKAESVIKSGDYRLVVLDEINYVLDYGFLETAPVVAALGSKPEKVHVVLTGRNAKPEIIEIADLVTEMKNIKHPFEQGILAQKGIEW